MDDSVKETVNKMAIEYEEYEMVLSENPTLAKIRVSRSEMNRIASTINTRRGFIVLQTGDFAGARVMGDRIVAFLPAGKVVPKDDVQAPSAQTTAACQHPADAVELRRKGDPPVFWKVCTKCGLKVTRIHKSHVDEPDKVPEYEGE